MKTYLPKSAVLKWGRELAAEARAEGERAGYARATEFVRMASTLNGSTHAVLKALQQEGEAAPVNRMAAVNDDASGVDEEAVTIAALDALIEAKTHHPETDGGPVYHYLAGLLADPEAMQAATAEMNGQDVVEKAFEESKHPRDHGKFSSKPGGSGDKFASGGKSSRPAILPANKDTIQDIADLLRMSLDDAVGDPKDQCIACAYAIKKMYPEAEIFDGIYRGQPHTLAKLAGKFIDVTADQFDDSPTVQVLDPDQLPSGYRRFDPAYPSKNEYEWETQKDIEDEFRKNLEAQAETDGYVFKAFDSSKHPRGDDGRFIGREQIHAAKSDPALAEKLREKTTDPGERKKLDAALAGETDLGRTKAGSHREAVAARRQDRAERVKRGQELANEISMARRGGEPVPSSHFRELAEHLPHMTVSELRSVRGKLAASFGGDTRKAQMVSRLLEHAKNKANLLETNEKYEDMDPLDFGSLDEYQNEGNAKGNEARNPNPEEQHGGRMAQRHQLMANLPESGKIAAGTPDTGSILKVPGKVADEQLTQKLDAEAAVLRALEWDRYQGSIAKKHAAVGEELRKLKQPSGESSNAPPDSAPLADIPATTSQGDTSSIPAAPQKTTIRVQHAKGYERGGGRFGQKSHVAKLSGLSGQYGFDRDFDEGTPDWGSSELYRKNKGTYHTQHDIPAEGGVYEVNEHGDKSYSVFYPHPEGGHGEYQSSEPALKEAYGLLDAAGMGHDEIVPAVGAGHGTKLKTVDRVKKYIAEKNGDPATPSAVETPEKSTERPIGSTVKVNDPFNPKNGMDAEVIGHKKNNAGDTLYEVRVDGRTYLLGEGKIAPAAEPPLPIGTEPEVAATDNPTPAIASQNRIDENVRDKAERVGIAKQLADNGKIDASEADAFIGGETQLTAHNLKWKWERAAEALGISPEQAAEALSKVKPSGEMKKPGMKKVATYRGSDLLRVLGMIDEKPQTKAVDAWDELRNELHVPAKKPIVHDDGATA